MNRIILFIVLLLVFSLQVQAQIFYDDFEDGSDNWEGDWTDYQTMSHSGTHSLVSNTAVNYPAWADSYVRITEEAAVDLSESQTASLNFWARWNVEQYFDWWYLDISADGGQNWVQLDVFTGDQDFWVEQTYDIGSYAGQSDVRIQFRLLADGAVQSAGVFIDDVAIYDLGNDTSIPLAQHVPVPENEGVPGDFDAVFTITDANEVDYANLIYSSDGGPEYQAELTEQIEDEYHFLIPAFLAGSRIEYYLELGDLNGIPNQGTTDTWSYYCGTMIEYMDDVRNNDLSLYYNNNTQVANWFTTEEPTYLAGLVFLFRMQVDSVDIQAWSNHADTNMPDTSLIETPYRIYPDNTLENPVTWTYVDLRDFTIPVEEDFHAGADFLSTHPGLMQEPHGGNQRGRINTGGNWSAHANNFFIRALVGNIYAEVAIQEIQTNPQLIGSRIYTDGIVTQPPLTTFNNRTEMYIQDETGYGVKVFSWDIVEDLQRGDEIEIYGTVVEANGITRIENFSYEVLTTGNPLPEPLTLPTGEMALSDTMEGTWAQINGALMEQPENDFGFFHLQDGSGACPIRILGNPGIPFANYNQYDGVTVNGVISITGGFAEIVPSMPVDVYGADLIIPPFFLTADIDTLTGVVTLAWTMSMGEFEELIYDNDNMVEPWYPDAGNSYGLRMSPAGPCILHSLKYFTQGEGGFEAGVYDWDGDEPSAQPRYSTQATAVDDGWAEVDISDEQLVCMGDFVVAFTGQGQDAGLGTEDHDEGRSWANSGQWQERHFLTYMIRAVVRYRDAALVTLGPDDFELVRIPAQAGDGEYSTGGGTVTGELDEFIGFNVYRDDTVIGTSMETSYNDTLQEGGTFTYHVTAEFDLGESDPSNQAEVQWSGVGVDDPENAGQIPDRFEIAKVYPNPFNSSVTVTVNLPAAANLAVRVYNLEGRLVSTLTDNRHPAGYREFTFDASDLASGLYFVKAEIPDRSSEVRKIVLIK